MSIDITTSSGRPLPTSKPWKIFASRAGRFIQKTQEYVLQGLDHIILWNATGMYNLSKTKSSYSVMKEVLAYVKG